jgi:hypothetical protein
MGCAAPRVVALFDMSVTLTFDIPEDISRELSAKFQNIGRAAMEALAAEAYEKDVLSLEQVRRLLSLASGWEAQDVLKRHGVWPGTTVEEVMSDMDTLKTLRAERL